MREILRCLPAAVDDIQVSPGLGRGIYDSAFFFHPRTSNLFYITMTPTRSEFLVHSHRAPLSPMDWSRKMGVMETPPPGGKKWCYVAMGFGKKTDFETGRTLDLDKTYKYIIKPAVTEAGLECVRSDEIPHSGVIDVPTYELLLKADLVIADVSTNNKNVWYELGVRHALRPYSTIVISEDGMKSFPFDVNLVLVRQYHHQGDAIDFEEVERFRKVLSAAIEDILSNEPTPPVDSPVYIFLPELRPLPGPAPGQPAEATWQPPAAGFRESQPTSLNKRPGASEPSAQSKEMARYVELLEQAAASRDPVAALAVLSSALKLLTAEESSGPITNAPDMIKRLVQAALAVAGPGRFETLRTARRIFEFLSPEGSNDPETLRLLGDVELAIFEEKKDINRLRRARQAYDRLYSINRDYRSGIILAYLVTLHAEHRQDVSEKMIDIGIANRLRREVVESGKVKLVRIDERYRTESRLLAEQGLSWTPEQADAAQERLGVWGAIAEAYYGLGDLENYRAALDETSLIPEDSPVLREFESRIRTLEPILGRQAAVLSSITEYAGKEIHPAAGPQPSPPVAGPPAREARRLDEREESRPARDLIFFSYSHNERDKGILEEIKKTLSPLFQDEPVQMWDDGHIKPGQEWEKEIREALSRAKGAVLLVSRDFLVSPFITKEELPVIMKGVEDEGITLMWVAVEKVLLQKSKIIKYQGLNDPRQEPLDAFEGTALKNKIYEICEKVAGVIFPDTA